MSSREARATLLWRIGLALPTGSWLQKLICWLEERR